MYSDYFNSKYGTYNSTKLDSLEQHLSYNMSFKGCIKKVTNKRELRTVKLTGVIR